MAFGIKHLCALTIVVTGFAHASAPSLPVPAVDLFENADYGQLPLRLLGVDLVKNGAIIPGPTPFIANEDRLTVVLYWEPIHRLASQVRVRATLWDRMCLIRRDTIWRVGPAGGEWLPGDIVQQTMQLDLTEMARSFSGLGYLNLTLLTPRDVEWKERPLMVQPILIEPTLRRSSVPLETIQTHLSEPFHFIDVQTRIGIEAATAFTVPEPFAELKQLYILSSLAYRSPAQNVPVCEITFLNADGRSATVPIRCGIETARADLDAYPNGELGHERVTILRSRDSGQLDRNGRPLQLYTYIEPVTVPAHVGTVTSIRLRGVADTFLDLYGLVLVP